MSLDSLSFSGVPLRQSSFHQLDTTPFMDMLNGSKAFYNQPDYLDATEREFAQNKTLPVNYTWNTENKIKRFALGIYKYLHALAGKILLPASSPTLIGYRKNYAHVLRSNISLFSEWKYKRITVEVNGYKIDAAIMGKASTLNNGRWMLASNGNGEFYEEKLFFDSDIKQILSKVNGNAIVFNYPGVGASSGFPNREAMAKAYCAMLNLLEDQKNGIGAKEIIGYGHSIGGGVQADALKTHELKKEIKYVFVKSRTFSDLTTIASILTCKPLGFLVKILGWNIGSVESSKELKAPEIIMQTASVDDAEELYDSAKIVDDGIIRAKASLAKALLDDHKCPRKNKVFLGIKEGHNDPLNDPSFLANKMEELLSQS